MHRVDKIGHFPNLVDTTRHTQARCFVAKIGHTVDPPFRALSFTSHSLVKKLRRATRTAQSKKKVFLLVESDVTGPSTPQNTYYYYDAIFCLEKECFNDWGGRGYDDSVPGAVTKTIPSGDRTT